MRCSTPLDFLAVGVLVIVASVGFSEAELEQSKIRRGGGATSGLFQFPRVGRSDPSLANGLHEMDASNGGAGPFDNVYSASVEDYEVDFPKSDVKRANLIAFPRIGRPDADVRKWARLMALQQAYEKRAGPTSGLWFGPRLGKRSIADDAKMPAAGKHLY